MEFPIFDFEKVADINFDEIFDYLQDYKSEACDNYFCFRLTKSFNNLYFNILMNADHRSEWYLSVKEDDSDAYLNINRDIKSIQLCVDAIKNNTIRLMKRDNDVFSQEFVSEDIRKDAFLIVSRLEERTPTH
jgi:hypothetical protein